MLSWKDLLSVDIVHMVFVAKANMFKINIKSTGLLIKGMSNIIQRRLQRG